jgi:hypothetical protein
VSAVTFNAYGAARIAANLGLDVGSYGAGGGFSNPAIVNHVRATDIVSAAGPHIGAVAVYATERDVELVIPFNEAPTALNFLRSLIDRLNPGETHAITQFYGDSSIVKLGNFDRYEQDAFWYDAYRTSIRSAATGAASSLVTLETMTDGLPENLSFAAALLGTYFDILRESNRQAENRFFLGTEADDLKTGGSSIDYLDGKGGRDILSGGGGNDRLRGGKGNDELRGDEGDDWLWGGDDNDYLDGGSGSDVLDGGAGYNQYNFFVSDFEQDPGSVDTIRSTSGQGFISINGAQMRVGRRLSQGGMGVFGSWIQAVVHGSGQ